ncbi:hypothetical protein GWO43_00845 [candidate division KSB1 bacterium]|nr:hypothetical protein [candidate division KSB1 bacterium]NIX69149.1 hypothetical protein [candidate division KSB1 bacterium]
MSNQLQLNIKEDFRTTLQSISSKDLWKDNQDFELKLGYPVNKALSLHSEFHSHILSDPLAGFDNDVVFHSGIARLNYVPRHTITIAPQVSSKWQTQLGQSDQGLSYGLDARIEEVEIQGYISDLSLSGEQDLFPERKNEDLKLRYQIERQFYESTADTLTIFFDRLRRDSFDAEGDEIVGRKIFVRNLTQSRRGIENHLSYRIASSSTLFLKNSFTAGSFTVNNLKQDTTEIRKDDATFESNHSVGIIVRHRTWFTNLGWSFRSRSLDDRRPVKGFLDPRHPSLGFDTEEVFVKLRLSSGLRVAKNDSLGVHASVSKFQFDTSDTTNPNDHDQIRWQLTFAHSHYFGSNLKLTWRASAFINHLVFISGQFSSGNNWERVFQLMPQIVYKPDDRLTLRQRFTVRAKYQTFDFDNPATSNRNTVNRQFIMANNSTIALSSRTWLETELSLELAEQGKLFYSLWRQQLALSWRNQEARVLLRHKLGPNFTVSAGGNIFHQIRWNHKLVAGEGSERTVRDKHTNLGPILQMSYRPSESVQFVFLGNVQVVTASRRETEYINNFDVNVNWLF